MDITPVIKAVLTLCVFTVTAFLLPWLKQVVGDKKTAEILKWVQIFVKAAEQIYRESGMGEKKKAYVLKRLAEKGYNLDLDTVDDMIEAAVLELNREV